MAEAESNILQAVAGEYGVTVDEIISRSRLRDIAEARQMAMYLIREVLDYTPDRIGEAIGRNRVTVIYAIQKIADLASVDKQTQRHLVNLQNVLDISQK